MWERRREKLMVQERCHFEWQNLIAEASRRGFNKEEELQWNSYEIMDEELEQEFLESIVQRKNIPRAKGSRRAPKSPEQRRKIAAAISAKWADPAYRDRVCSSLSKYHGSPARAERQPRRRPCNASPRQPRTPSPTRKKANNKPAKMGKTRFRRRKVPLYKDPLVSSKLEMIKNIRAQREFTGTKKSQAIEQAKLLIAEAEKAAKVLEAAALRSPLALASLSETRNIIAEAIQSIQSIEIQTSNCGTNGTPPMKSFEGNIEDFGISEFNFKEVINGEIGDPCASFGLNGFNIPGINGYTKTKETSFGEKLSHPEMNGHSKHDKALPPNGAHFKFEKQETSPKSITVYKKWICGRLVEVVEGDKINIK